MFNWVRASPMKDLTSDNTSDFAMGRREYGKTFATLPPKKWYGDRSASSVIDKNKIRELGNASLNASAKPMSFVNVVADNGANQARQRMRSGGYMVGGNRKHY
jgi:hypothetical protein